MTGAAKQKIRWGRVTLWVAGVVAAVCAISVISMPVLMARAHADGALRETQVDARNLADCTERFASAQHRLPSRLDALAPCIGTIPAPHGGGRFVLESDATGFQIVSVDFDHQRTLIERRPIPASVSSPNHERPSP